MSLVLSFCWREWRAQRGMLLGYTGMGLAALCLVFVLLPKEWWLEDGQRALALAWFTALGVVGVVAFVTPTLVRGEFGAKDDTFVRRLPGALLPSFGGKLLFLVLAAAALPLVCLLAGEGLLLTIDQPWHDLFTWEYSGDVSLRWPWPAPVLGYAALLAPWVWAVGTWLPGGRMALGGALLLGLGIAALVLLVLRGSPGLVQHVAWRDWLWAVPVSGVLAAAASWAVGRRGGGAWRSARYGLGVAAVGFAPLAVWLGERVWDFHHPDPRRLAHFVAWGVAPDLRHVLAYGAAAPAYTEARVPFRIDLADGKAEQLGGIGMYFSPELHHPMAVGAWDRSRWWDCCDYDAKREMVMRYRLFDLVEGRLHTSDAATPAAMRAELLARVGFDRDRPERPSGLCAPGGVGVRFDATELCFEVAPGRVERIRWEGKVPSTYGPIGHGFRTFGPAAIVYDFATRTASPIDHGDMVWLVRGVVVRRTHGSTGWTRRDPGIGMAAPIAELANATCLGLLDDDRLLCRGERVTGPTIFAWHVATGAVEDVALGVRTRGASRVETVAPLHECGSLLPRDAEGRVWLRVDEPGCCTLLRLDPATLRVEALAFQPAAADRSFRLLAWLEDGVSFLVQDANTIQRVDVATGVRTQLFPREETTR